MKTEPADIGTFPFGRPVRVLKQTDQTPKKLFVLGVYASAVHARWIGPDGKTRIRALAVASKPEIFWRGDNAANVINNITIPPNVGHLEAAAQQFNGPSGRALDDQFIKPLGITRSDAWLCDLVPHSCLNPNQRRAIREKYTPFIEEWDLPAAKVLKAPTRLADEARRQAILTELQLSQAEILMLLGDQPIKWFLAYFDNRWQRLADFSNPKEDGYGQLHPVTIGGRTLQVLPLVHPRQAAKLGRANPEWYETHKTWLAQRAASLLG